HTRFARDWSSDVCSSDLKTERVNGISYDIIWEIARTAPISEYLLFDPHPAIRIPNTSTATMVSRKKTPIVAAEPCRSGATGNTAYPAKTAQKITKGARRNSFRSAAFGTISSLNSNLIRSAISWRRHHLPTSIGPIRSWIKAETFLSR